MEGLQNALGDADFWALSFVFGVCKIEFERRRRLKNVGDARDERDNLGNLDVKRFRLAFVLAVRAARTPKRAKRFATAA